MADRNFDSLAERFEKNFYQSTRGQLRLQLVQDALLEDSGLLGSGRSLRILDAGCGMGQMSLWLARQGHEVLACDISEILLSRARQLLAEQADAKQLHIAFHNVPLQALSSVCAGSFDLVLCHAVLEWLDSPREGLRSLYPWLKPGGELSLMYYNHHSLVFKNLLRGNLAKVEAGDYRADGNSLTPVNPLQPDRVAEWLQADGLVIESWRGIRTFYEYMDQTLHPGRKPECTPEAILRLEKQFGKQEPYRSLGRYQLLHCHKRA